MRWESGGSEVHVRHNRCCALRREWLAPEAAEAFRATYEDSPLPSPSGYGQLAVILEKQMRYEEAISLCAGAEQEGWAGDWGKRIERRRKKLAKRLGGK
jgi:hypothetical protein